MRRMTQSITSYLLYKSNKKGQDLGQHLLSELRAEKKTKRSSHSAKPVTIGGDQGTPCIELQVVVWILDKKVLREPAGTKTELVTAEIYLLQLKHIGCCMTRSYQCKLPAPDVCQPRDIRTQQGLLA